MQIRKEILPVVAAALSAAMASAQDKRPNIVIIITDQQRADLCAREGYPCDITPFADRMGAEGAWFDRCYTPMPASGPARVSALTGRFPKVTHADSNHNLLDAVYSKDLFDVAAESGYASVLVGKNHSHLSKADADGWIPYDHLGQTPPAEGRSEENAAFDKFLHSMDFFYSEDPAPGTVDNQQPYRMVTDALDWMDSHRDRPFVMWFAVNEPHNPYQVCEPYYSMFSGKAPKPDTDPSDLPSKGEKYQLMFEQMNQWHRGCYDRLERIRSNYMGMIRLIDDQICRMAGGMKDLGLYDNTVFVITSDHGDYCGEYGLMKKGAGLDEATTRIPMVWFGKGILSSGRRRDFVSLVDIMPTACELMGAEIPVGVQGRSLLPMLSGQDYPEEEFSSIMSEHGFGGQFITAQDDPSSYYDKGALGPNLFYDELNTWSQSGRTCMVRKGDWKIIVDMTGSVRLYNVVKDPHELRNLSGRRRYSSVEKDMMRELLKWEISTVDPMPVPRHRYTQKRFQHNYMFCGTPEK